MESIFGITDSKASHKENYFHQGLVFAVSNYVWDSIHTNVFKIQRKKYNFFLMGADLQLKKND